VSIPRILHRIWVGPDPLPDEFARYGEAWRRMHPDWEHRLWTEEDLPHDVERREILERNRIPAERADVLRYELLWRMGGVYVDTDIEPLRPLDPLVAELEFFTGEMKPGRINNAVIGTAPGSPVLRAAVDEARFPVIEDALAPPPPLVKEATGPVFFGRVVARFPEATVFPPPVFYPGTEEERATAYTRHYSARSWAAFSSVEDEIRKLRERLDKAEARVVKANARAETYRRQRDEARAELARSGVQRLLGRLSR